MRSAADHVIAYDRGGALAVATRLPVGLAARGGWGDTRIELPPGRWWDVLTEGPDARQGRASFGGAVPLGELLGTYPVALLVREPA